MSEHGGTQDAGGQTPRRRRPSRVLAWVGVAVAVVLVAGVLTAYAAYRDVFDKIHHVNVTGLGKRPPGYDNSLNILLIGSDSRAGKNSKFGAGISGQRSDTILVLHVSPGFRRAVMLSLPRDSVVPILACPASDGTGGQPAQPGQIEQINATFANGGPGCLWKTIEQTTGIRLDHFMELNFTGFEHVINDLGGVSICLPYGINNPQSKLHLSAGLHHVMGSTALAYWRVRYIGQGSDLERITRDQYLMASLAQSIKRADLLGDPARLYRVISDVTSSLTTDSQLSENMMISLAQGLRNISLKNVHFIQAPTVAYPPNPNWVEWSPQATILFKAIAQDRKLPRLHHHRHRRHATGPSNGVPATSSGGRSSTRSPSAGGSSSPAASAAPSSTPGGSGLTKNYGGITAGANVCHDSGAFAGPLGGH
jgi:LCP family protein required for cell wall assembly